MRELERQQKEQEQNADRVFDMQSSAGIDPIARSRLAISSASTIPIRGSSMSSRRSSEDSLEEEGRSLRDIRHELKVCLIGGGILLSCKIDVNIEFCGRMLKNVFEKR